jgi:Smg protein
MSFRVLGPHERGRFSADAWGHLLSLTGAGFLSPAELEQVIDRALAHIDGRIALDDVRTLLEGAGLEDHGSGPEPVTVH